MGFSKLVGSGLRLVSSAASTLSAFAVSAYGVLTAATPAEVHTINVVGSKSTLLGFLGTAAADLTFSVRVSVRIPIIGADNDYAGAYSLVYLGTVDVTPGSATVVIGGVTYYVADTLTWTPSSLVTTPKGPCAAFANARGEDLGTTYSPADNTMATLLISHLGMGDELWLDYDRTGAASCNALVLEARA